jgi:hypothetical protein
LKDILHTAIFSHTAVHIYFKNKKEMKIGCIFSMLKKKKSMKNETVELEILQACVKHQPTELGTQSSFICMANPGESPQPTN